MYQQFLAIYLKRLFGTKYGMTELSYHPLEQLMISAVIRCPFYSAWKKTSEIYESDVINRFESERIINNANMVYGTSFIAFHSEKANPR